MINIALPCLALPFVYTASFPRKWGLQLRMPFFILDRQLKRSDASGGILQSLISFLTVWSHVFLGRPGGLVPRASMYNASWMQPVSRSTCPYQRRRLQLRTLVIDGICNCSSNDSELLLSSHFTLQIQRIIERSVLWRRAWSTDVRAQHSEACNMTLRIIDVKHSPSCDKWQRAAGQ